MQKRYACEKNMVKSMGEVGKFICVCVCSWAWRVYIFCTSIVHPRRRNILSRLSSRGGGNEILTAACLFSSVSLIFLYPFVFASLSLPDTETSFVRLSILPSRARRVFYRTVTRSFRALARTRRSAFSIRNRKIKKKGWKSVGTKEREEEKKYGVR